MIEGIDKGWILHKFNSLVSPIKAGITNTEQAVYTYLFTADNELDYQASIASATKVTVSELPSTTVSIFVSIFITRVSNSGTILEIKRESTDTNLFTFKINHDSNNITAELGGTYEIPINGNEFYVVSLGSTCSTFDIFGYREKV